MNTSDHFKGGIAEEPYEIILTDSPAPGLAKIFYTPPRLGIHPGKKSPAHELYLRGLSLPNALDSSVSMGQVVADVKEFLKAQAHLASPAAALCTLWTIHTWFADILPLSPPLVITGPRLEAESLLSALQAVCRNGLMIFAGATVRDLKNLPIADLFPTLILPEPQLSKGMESLLSLSSRPGRLLAGAVPDIYRAVRVPTLQDRFCPKAMYLGEDASCSVGIPNVIRLYLTPDPAAADAPQVTAMQLQNRLFGLRFRLWPEVEQSTFVAETLSAQTREVASVLGRVVGNDAAAHASVVSLLSPQDEIMRAERASTLEALTVEAITTLLHEDGGVTELLASTIGARVNRLLDERQETWKVSAEQIGHVLKRIGLPTTRLGSAGRGLKLDNATQANAHRQAYFYGVLVSFDGQVCRFCEALGVEHAMASSQK